MLFASPVKYFYNCKSLQAIHLETAKKCICKEALVSSILVKSSNVLANNLRFRRISAVWHPRCGPCPSSELGGVLNGGTVALAGHAANGNATDTDCDRLSNSAMSEQVSFTNARMIAMKYKM